MKRITDFCVLGALTLSLCLAGVANAAPNPPAECDGGRNERFFRFGYIKGASLVNQAWAGLGGDPCRSEELATFVDNVMAAFTAGAPPSDAPTTVLCHYAGSYQGAGERASELVRQCVGECCTEGELIGEMAAVFYCELSIQLDGLGLDDWLVELDTTLCSEEFTECCQRLFDDVTVAYPSPGDSQCEPYRASDPPDDCPPYVPEAVNMQCEEYDEVYCQARHNQCVYEPEWP
jgi:hypothetical protein